MIYKYFTILFLSFLFSSFAISCSEGEEQDNHSVSGVIEQGDNLTVKFNKIRFDNLEELQKTTTDSEGAFHFSFPKGFEAGLYQMTLGSKKANFIFDGNEEDVVIKGTLSDLDQMTYTVEGSELTHEFLDVMRRVNNREIDTRELMTYLQEAENPLVAMQVALVTIGGRPDYLKVYQNINEKLKAKYENLYIQSAFDDFIAQLDKAQQKKNQQAKVQVGTEAPEIALPDPHGNIKKLSDLRGNLVLLDFWASWCKPCRKANPKVVEVYNKYKDQGFTVYSVSLDGMDDRVRQQLPTQEAQQEFLEKQKEKWVQAIEQDNLTWNYHVSDLSRFNTEPVQEYGVRGIPMTFLIGRDGKILEVNPRYNLEEAVQKHI